MGVAKQFSIVIPCRNPGPRLHDALRSVWTQKQVTPQVIVVDGGSTDGSQEWLASERGRIDVLVSEPDKGIYEAMNKGVAAADGEWVMFLGADDRLANDTVLCGVLHWAEKADADVLAGEAIYEDGRMYRFSTRLNPIARNFVHHQSAFYRRSMFERHGVFDTSLAVTADYDLNLRLWNSRVRFAPIPLRIAACGIGGASDGGAWRVYREEITTRHRHFAAWRCWPWDALSLARFVRKQVVRRSSR